MIENWIELVMGALVLVSPWILGFSDISLARWLNVLCGMVLVLMNVWAIYGKDKDQAVAMSTTEAIMIEKTPRQKQKRVRRVVSTVRARKVEQVLTNS